MKRAAIAVLLSIGGLWLFDLALFHSGLYARYMDPDSTGGYLESVISQEILRSKDSPNQIVAIGDSRMVMQARIANERTEETGYTFASLGVAGSTPRAWYYMLRAVDPDANQYRAVIITLESYDDPDGLDDDANRAVDLNYLIARLGMSDIASYAGSYHDPWSRWQVVRGLLFKGFVYKADLQRLLEAPLERIQKTADVRKHGFTWRYDFVGPEESVAPLTVNWEQREVEFREGFPEDRAAGLRHILVDPLPPQTGERKAYLTEWLGKIQQHYEGSETKVIVVRLPRAAWIRPDLPTDPNSSVRMLKGTPNMVVVDEHTFEYLETPEMFLDELHLNWPGSLEFTDRLVDETVAILGPPI